MNEMKPRVRWEVIHTIFLSVIVVFIIIATAIFMQSVRPALFIDNYSFKILIPALFGIVLGLLLSSLSPVRFMDKHILLIASVCFIFAIIIFFIDIYYGYMADALAGYYYFLLMFSILGFLIGFLVGSITVEHWTRKEKETIKTIEIIIIKYILISSVPNSKYQNEFKKFPRNISARIINITSFKNYKDIHFRKNIIINTFLDEEIFEQFRQILKQVYFERQIPESVHYYKKMYEKHIDEIDKDIEIWLDKVMSGHCPYLECPSTLYYGLTNCPGCRAELPDKKYFITEEYNQIERDITLFNQRIKNDFPCSYIFPCIFVNAFNELWFKIIVKEKKGRNSIALPIILINHLMNQWKKEPYKIVLIKLQKYIDTEYGDSAFFNALKDKIIIEQFELYANEYIHDLTESVSVNDIISNSEELLSGYPNEINDECSLIINKSKKIIWESLQNLVKPGGTITNIHNQLELSNYKTEQAQLFAATKWISKIMSNSFINIIKVLDGRRK